MAWIAFIAALVLLTIAQEWFLETHRRRYGMWRSFRERRLWANLDERRLMWPEYVHRNDDPRVEFSRLCLWGAAVLVVVAGAALLNSGR